MTRIYFFKSNGLTKKDQVKMTKVGTNMLSDTAKRRQKDGNETATSDKVIIRTSLGHFLRYVAMIFAVLVMSVANIGMAWGVDYSSTPLVSLDFSSSLPTVSGVTYNAASYSSGKISWSGNYSKGSRDVQIAFTTTGGHFKLVIGHVTSGSSMTFKYTLDSGSAQNLTFNKSATSDTYEITASAGSHTISLGPGGSSTRTVVTSIAIYDEASSCSATADAGADKSTTVGVGVAMAATAASSGYTGAWSIKAGSPSTATSQLSSTSSATATFTPTAAGTYTLVWTVTDNSDGTCSASDEATVTVSAPVVTHNITYTNLKGADNSANPTTYTEGVGVASFANLRHVVGYDFTGWSPSSISSSATTDQTIDAQWTARAAATGTGTLTYALAFGTSTITTSSITRNNSALYDATDVSIAHTTFNDGAAKNGCSGKLTTTEAKDASNYVELTFKIADGYTFTPTEVQVRGNAVSTAKTMEVELKDNAATPNTKSVTGSLAAGSTDGGTTVTLDFDASGTVTLEGTVTLKIFVYGATNHWRLGTSIIVNGTVASAASDAYGIYIGKNNDNYTLENLTNTSGTTWSKTITLDAGSYYEFKVKKTPSAGDAVWYGNNGKITATTSPAWDFNTSDGNCKLYTTVAGSYTFSWDASTNKLTVTYPAGDHPTKRIYMACGSTWCDASPKFFVHSWGVTEYNTQVQESTCDGYYADIIWYNDYFQFTRNASNATAYDNNQWNVSQDLTYNSSQPKWTCTGWSDGKGTFSSSAYTPTTYTISYATGSTTATGGAAISGSKANETKTCGVDFTLPSSAVFTAAGYTQVGWTTTDGGAQTHALGGSYTGNAAQTFYPVWEATASLTALECNTLYKVNAMVPASITLTGEGQYGAGLSANTKFEVIGDPSKTDQAGGAPEMKNISTVTIDGTDFGAAMYLKRAANISSTLPTSHAVKFIVPETGKLVMYVKRSDRLYLIKEGGSAVSLGSSDSNVKVEKDVTAGTYYIYANNTNTVVYGLKLVTCTTPAAPTAFSAGSITSTGATFSITDAGDAASYDIYYSTSSDAPTASTPATTTSTSKTKAVTGLTASTTYYAWVRSVCDASHKSDWVALSGSSFTTSAGGGCTPQSVVKTVLSSTTAGTTTGYNNNEYAGSATIVTFQGTPIDGGYKMQSGSKLFVTLKKGNFVEGDKINIVITKASDLTNTTGKLPIFYNASSPALLTTIDAASAGTYTYTLTASDITTLGSNKTIGVFRSSSTTENNPYVKSVEVEGCRDWTVDETAPTFVSSVPANGATGVATSGTIVLTFSEALGTVDASKFTLTGATKGAVSIDGSDATKVNIAYSGAANEATVTLATAAAAVSDVAGNALAAALSDISFTTAAAAPAGDCITIAYFETTSHNNSSSKPDNAGKYIYGYTNSAKTEAYAYTITSSTGDNKGQGTGESDYLRMNYGTTVTIYADNTTTGGTPASFSNVTSVSVDFKMMKSTYYTSFDIYVGGTKIANNVSLEGAAQSAFTTFTYDNLEQLSGTVRIVNKGSGSSNYHFYVDNIQICTSSLPSCTTPELPTLTAKTICEGGDAAEAWDATITNSGSLVSGETVAYSWVKKGSSTVLSSVATYQPTDVTEAMAGTYVVTATVSADDKASKSASKEVELAVNATVEISNVTQSPATVYASNSVTLTATANVSATWQWYTCTNAEGDGESSIGNATSAAYAFTAPASAGTYYYKVKATGPCGGVATEVYALTVSAATGGECFHFVSVLPASDISVSSGANLVTPTHATTLEGGTMKVGSQQVTFTKDYGLKMEGTKTVSITLDAALEAGNVVIVKGTSGTKGYGITINGVNFYDADNKTFDVSYTVLADDGLVGKTALTVSKYSGSSYLQEVKITGCGASCTDPAVTASVSKSNVCAGSGEGVTFTASDAHADASYQWQKQNGSAWEDISGATAATYTITTVEASHAGKYRVVASHECDRISNELTLTVATTPVFGDLGGAREVETGGSLSITDIEATSATSYKWYKSANDTYDSGSDEQVGTSKNLMLPVSETAGSTFYLFCVASNACTSTVSNVITVSVIAPVEKDCAVAASNGENFTTAKTSNVNSGTYNSQTELHMNNNNKYIYYVAATGYHFETATVNCCAGDATALTKAAYGYSTDGGATWTDADLPGAMTNQYSNHVVNLPADVNAFRVGRVLGDHGVGSNTLYVHEVCFTYVADCNATTIAISNATPSYDLSVGGDFTEPTCTVKQGGTTLSPQPALRYSSFNEAIATVDPSTGEVDFTGTAGSVMIMASYDGDETYCESSATYTITVSCGSESAPKIVAGSGTNLSGCNAEVNLVVKDQSGNDFASGSYQWYRDGEEIDGATSATYTANRTGTYTVSHTGVCTQMSTNSAVVTSESFDPSVERLVPFQYYHANKTYTDQMKMRHLFAVTSGGDYEGKRYYMTATRNGAPLDITTSTAFSVRTSKDNRVDSVMIDLNRLDGKFNAGDEIVLTCAAIADCGTISAVTENIEIHVIDNTPTLALICSGTNKSAGTRKTGELTVGGDFLTGYNKADLCEQTGSTSFDANTEWGLYTELKEHYIVTPVNGYAVFNKLNYEPFDILLLTDYPKASKSTEAALILDDMYELCDYRPMLSFKTHMVQPADKLDGRESHWKKKGFTTQPEVPKQSRLRLNIVCYAHPMFEEITEGVANDYDDESQIVYTMLSGPGHESEKGMQGFHLAAAENFVTIGLVHFNATATDNYDGSGNVKWTPGSGDEMLVAAAERQTNLEARFILFSLNCGAQSKLTAQGNTVVLKCLEYLLNDATIEGNVADCELTFDNKAGDHKWSNKANWAPKYSAIPGEYNSTRIAAPATVDLPHAKVMSVRIKEGGSIYIPAGSALDVKSTVRHKDVGSDVRPTDVDEIHIGSSASGNGTLIFNNNSGDTKARVDMYSNAPADVEHMSAATSTWQYIGTPHTDVANARSNYYGSWLYQYVGGTWTVIPNGGPLVAFRGYCITNETAPIVYDMAGTLVATTTQDIAIPAGYTVIANSWVAPIDITTFTDDDMENISDKTIYFFNTGTDAEGTAGTGTAPGTYVAVPKNSASYVGTWQIPSMQGFYISTTSAGTLHLDYDRHVRPTGSRSVVSNPMYAPRRAAAESDEPNVLKIFARGSRYQDKLVVLEREDFTRGYDSGWDGEAWGGSDLSPMVYVTGEGREDAVSAIPEFEGTVVAFKAGEDSEYRFEFVYSEDAEPLYLFDTENNTYTQIMTGNAYYFTTSDKSPHSRFILTRKNPQVATGVEPTSDSSLKGRAKKLLIEDKMFIMVNGMLYDATGKVVK